MLSEKDIQERIRALDRRIYAELDTGTNDPVQQWAALKTLHARRDELQEVLKGVSRT